MNLCSVPSLKSLVLVQSAAMLWNQEDARSLISKVPGAVVPLLKNLVLDRLYMLKDKDRRNLTAKASCNFVPALESLVLEKLAILGHLDDAQSFLTKLCGVKLIYGVRIKKEVWLEAKEKVREKVKRLQLPQILEKELFTYVEGVGQQIGQWIDFHGNECKLVVVLPREFCWTPQGTIDKKKTAELILKNGNQSIMERYIIACVYCLEDHIYSLWKDLTEFCRRSLWKMRLSMPLLVTFWSRHVERQVYELNVSQGPLSDDYSNYKGALSSCDSSGNEVGIRHFLKKLKPEEIGYFSVKAAICVAQRRCSECCEKTYFEKHRYSEALFFLLLTMNKKEQKKVFANCSFEVLKCFLDWPWQHLFIETATNIWSYLTEADFLRLFQYIVINKIVPGSKDYDYEGLLYRFWCESPITHKKYITVFERASRGLFFESLDEVPISEETFELVLNYITNKTETSLGPSQYRMQLLVDLV